MFIPYIRSNGDTKVSRRAIRTFVAVQAARKRKRVQTSMFNVEFLADWTITSQKDPSSPPDARVHGLGLQPTMARPVAAWKFYPMQSVHLQSQGHFKSRGLSYYFDEMSPRNSGALGHGPSQGQYYGSVILYWSSSQESILHRLVAWGLCALESQQRTNDSAHGAILYHCRKLLGEVQRMLSGYGVDDVLISALSLLIAVDDYLGHVEYSRAHLVGLDAAIEARGGYDQLGSSIPAMTNDVQVSTLIIRSLLLVHAINTEPPLHMQPTDPPLSLHIPPDLPRGFRDLIQRGRLSRSSIEMLHSFSVWQNKHGGQDPSIVPVWRYPAPLEKLTPIEKCIFLALLCLADDTSHIALHPAATIYRQATKRADMIQNMQRVWDDPSLGDCLVWLWMVTLTPRNAEHTLSGAQRELFRRLCFMRGDVLTWEAILSILQTFFYDQGRVLAWQTTWNVVREGMQNKFTQHDIVACSEIEL
ncbi:hypothetical protein BJX68DRAFT_262326 [Aspergillus pseudodeflectus]|uniref:Fungal-specific transcription factor domain-containing protein n=1 Tax=Aspergillus pseudodeflectus TaxID=176178 RepID=A0ABR4L2N1_9EURO